MSYYYTKIITGILCVALTTAGFYFYKSRAKTATTHEDEVVYETYSVNHPLQPIPSIKYIDKRWVSLGKALFHSPLLSKDNTVSCASCHMVDYGGDDGFSVSSGVGSKVGIRNSPTVLNSAFNFRQFWDGRSITLEEQIDGPIHNPVEMGTNWADIIEKLSRDEMFQYAFEELAITAIKPEHVKKAIVLYEKSLITPNSPIDRYLLGDQSALSTQQVRGLSKFVDFGCITCHQGKNIGGNVFQKLGRIKHMPKNLSLDYGRYLVTHNEADKHVFKVPSLRNVMHTAPYFHDGSVETIEEAISIMAETQLGRKISQQDIEDIKALLESFSGQLATESTL